MRLTHALAVACLSAYAALPAFAQTDVNQNAKLTATLENSSKEAQEHAATVVVHVTGIKLIDPDKTSGKPVAGQGHIHYQLDNGPIVASPDNKIAYHGLTPGQHTISVMLANNDHTPIGQSSTLTVNVPQS